MPDASPSFGLVLTGGGARAAYQAGVLRYVGEAFAEHRFDVITGVSAGAINASHLANHVGTLRSATASLVQAWDAIATEQVYGLRSRWRAVQQVFGRYQPETPEEHGLVDTAPLRDFLRRQLGTPDGLLRGTHENLRTGRLRAFAVTTTSYTTGQTVTWVQGEAIRDWERPNRVGVRGAVTVEHVMASSALPFFFPAVRLGNAWYGDGGVRLAAPLAPALHLGATRLLAVSTRYDRSRAEADAPAVEGYPPAAQLLGVLSNAVFLDALDDDAHQLRRINRLLRHVPPEARGGLRPVQLLLMRPSVDLGRLAHQYEVAVPPLLRLVMWGLGSRKTKSPDSLAMLLFEQPYVQQLLDIGYRDAQRQHDRLAAFFEA